MIDLKPGRYFLAQWFVEWETLNWMCCAWRDADDIWHIQYRFRYFNPESTDPHDGKDEKNWYHATSKPEVPESQTEELCDSIFEMNTNDSPYGEPTFVSKIEIRGDYKKAARLMRRPYHNAKVMNDSGKPLKDDETIGDFMNRPRMEP